MLGIYHGQPYTVVSLRRFQFMPRWLSADNTHSFLCSREKVRLYRSFADAVLGERPRKIVLRRTYALGDILMLLPVARALHRQLDLEQPIGIVVRRSYFDQLRGARIPEIMFHVEQGSTHDYGADLHFDLNSVLEVDHRGGPASDYHRCELYAAALGVDLV